MPAPRLRGHGFRDDPPQRVEIDDPVDLAAEGRRPGGEEHGILEGRAEEADGERGGGRRAHGASSVGPRRPGTGGLTVAATASGGERNSKPSARARESSAWNRSEEHTSELQSRLHLVCRLLLEKKKTSPARR